MKRFRFRLHRLERLRHAERRESEAQMALALADASERRLQREELEQVADRAHLRWHEEARTGGSEARCLRGVAELIDQARKAVTMARRAETKALEVVAARHRIYTEKSRAHRVVHKLRERKRRRWQVDAAREEQRLLDELHLLRLGRGDRSREESS